VSIQTPTLEDWVDAETDADADEQHDDSGDENAPGWGESTIRCECGADISQWHTNAESRRLVRVYATETGRVPACPECVEYPSGDHSFDTIPHAIRAAEPTSSCERVDHVALILREVTR